MTAVLPDTIDELDFAPTFGCEMEHVHEASGSTDDADRAIRTLCECRRSPAWLCCPTCWIVLTKRIERGAPIVDPRCSHAVTLRIVDWL